MSRAAYFRKSDRFGFLGARPDLPTNAQVSAAAKEFRQIRKLIFFEGMVGSNFGFGASISFNPLTSSSPEGHIEVALSEAAFTFAPRTPEGWSWSEDVKSLVRSSDHSVAVRESSSSTSSSGTSGNLKSQASLGAGLPILAALKANLTLGGEASRSAQRGDTAASERSFSQIDHLAQMSRPDGRFALRLTSRKGDDLIRFNSHLDRIPVLHPPDAAALNEDVTVTASVHPSGELRHAVRIIGVSGSWSRATESRNKQILSELLLNKIVDGPTRLWPKRRRRK